MGRSWVRVSVNFASATCPPGLLSPSFRSLTLQLKWGGQGLPTHQGWGQKAPLPPLPLCPCDSLLAEAGASPGMPTECPSSPRTAPEGWAFGL